MVQISCRDLCLGYERKEIVRNLNFEVCSGDYLCVIGENGSGKTTLLKVILGLDKPMSGTLELCGGLRRRDIGYLPQQNEFQKDFPATVREIVLSGRQAKRGLRPFYSAQDKEIAQHYAGKLGISDLMGRCYRELSGGQRQRALIARALCAADKMLIMDEPVAALDNSSAVEMYDIVSELNEKGMTVVMVTHDSAAVRRNAKTVLEIGNRIFCGSTGDFMALSPKES